MQNQTSYQLLGYRVNEECEIGLDKGRLRALNEGKFFQGVVGVIWYWQIVGVLSPADVVLEDLEFDLFDSSGSIEGIIQNALIADIVVVIQPDISDENIEKPERRRPVDRQWEHNASCTDDCGPEESIRTIWIVLNLSFN